MWPIAVFEPDSTTLGHDAVICVSRVPSAKLDISLQLLGTSYIIVQPQPNATEDMLFYYLLRDG